MKKLLFIKKLDNKIRLNQFIANAGISSRREADKLIKAGLIEINGKIINTLGKKISKNDIIKFDNQILKPDPLIYILLNKPKGYISSTKDEKMRKTVIDLVANNYPYRLFPVGRLDRSTTGVLLITNDGLITKKLTHPSFKIKKKYHISLSKTLSMQDFFLIKKKGIYLYEGLVKIDKISFIENQPKTEINIEIHIGWNRVIRRIFKKLNYDIISLDRVNFAGLNKKKLKKGQWRILNNKEIENLYKI